MSSLRPPPPPNFVISPQYNYSESPLFIRQLSVTFPVSSAIVYLHAPVVSPHFVQH